MKKSFLLEEWNIGSPGNSVAGGMHQRHARAGTA